MMPSVMIITCFSLPSAHQAFLLKHHQLLLLKMAILYTGTYLALYLIWSRMMKLHLADDTITFSAITNNNNTGVCKQLGYIFWGFKVIWFLHNCFIKIGWFKAYSQLKISLLIFPLNLYKAVDPRSCLVHRLQNSCLVHLVNLLLESLFQMHRDWSTRGLLWCDTGIHLDMV